MKRSINVIFCLLFICVQISIELRPLGELWIRKYMSEIDYESILNTKPIAEYMAHFSAEEKNQIVSFLKELYKPKNK